MQLIPSVAEPKVLWELQDGVTVIETDDKSKTRNLSSRYDCCHDNMTSGLKQIGN